MFIGPNQLQTKVLHRVNTLLDKQRGKFEFAILLYECFVNDIDRIKYTLKHRKITYKIYTNKQNFTR